MNILDGGNYAISAFVDLTKAFGTADREILLDKMDRYEIEGHANDFFPSYILIIQNRIQHLIVLDLI